MRKLVLVLALILGGCASLPSVPNPLSPSSLYDIENAYGVALSQAVAYRGRPLCKVGHLESVTNICARRSIIVRLQKADGKAQIALANAKAFVRDNPTLDATSVLAIAQAAVTTFIQASQVQ